MLIPSTAAHAAVQDSSHTSTLFGATISSPVDLTMKTKQFGHLPIVRVYYHLPPSNAWTTGLAEANHSDVIVSFKALPLAIMNGSDNAALENFFDTAPRGPDTIYYTYYHEPEDNIAHLQFTLKDYLTAWADVVRMADAAHNPYLHSTLTLMSWDLSPYSHRTWTNYLPPGHIISTMAWDSYPDNGVGTPSPASFMAPAIAASKAAGLPFGFAGINTTTIPGRPTWYAELGDYVRSSGALFGTLYDNRYGGGLGGSGSFFVTDHASASAWKSVVSNSGTTDNQPPTVPTHLAATVVSGSDVQLRWTASTDNVAVTGYNIYHDGDLTGTSSSTSYNDTGLAAGTTYQFSVSAYDGAGNVSAKTSPISVTTPTTGGPTTPADLVATAVSGSEVDLSWTASTDAGGTVTGYDVYRNGELIGTSSTTSYRDTGLTAGNTYEYSVSAFDAAGKASAETKSVSVTTAGAGSQPTMPTDVKATALNGSTAVLTWTASSDKTGITGYDIYCNGRLVATSTTTHFTDTGLNEGWTYGYSLSARDASGQASYHTKGVTVTMPYSETAGTPTGLRATGVTAGEVTLSWRPSGDKFPVTGYDIYRDRRLVGRSTTTSFSDTGLVASTSYRYTVDAYNAAGTTTSKSVSVSATTT